MASISGRQPCRLGAVMTHIIFFFALCPLCLTQTMETFPEFTLVEAVDITTSKTLPESSMDSRTKSMTRAELHSTQPDELTTAAKLHSTQSDELTTAAELRSTQPDDITTAAELHSTRPDELTTTVLMTTRDTEKTTTLIIYQSQNYRMKFSGNCADIIRDEVVENAFKTRVRDAVVSGLGLRDTQPLVIGPVECGSVLVSFTIYNVTQADRIEQKMKELVALGNLSITITGLNSTFIAENVENMDDTMTTVTITTIPATRKPHSDDGGLTNVQIILIIVLSVVGVSLLLAALIGTLYTYHNRGKSQTFNLGQPAKVQEMGAEDFTLIKMDRPEPDSNERYINGERLMKTTSAGDDGDPNESATLPLASRSRQGHEEVLVSLHQTPIDSATGVDNPCFSTDDGSLGNITNSLEAPSKPDPPDSDNFFLMQPDVVVAAHGCTELLPPSQGATPF